jgi:hypothetical protein
MATGLFQPLGVRAPLGGDVGFDARRGVVGERHAQVGHRRPDDHAQRAADGRADRLVGERDRVERRAPPPPIVGERALGGARKLDVGVLVGALDAAAQAARGRLDERQLLGGGGGVERQGVEADLERAQQRARLVGGECRKSSGQSLRRLHLLTRESRYGRCAL